MSISEIKEFLDQLAGNQANFTDCERIVVIDGALIPETYKPTWLGKNKDYLSLYTDTDPLFYFIVDKFLELKKDYEHTLLAQWLDDNSPFISFQDTYENIECFHKMDGRSVEYSSVHPVIATAVYGDFLNDILNKKMILKQNKLIDYQCFVDLDLDTTARTVTTKLNPTYDSEGNFFSIPFIKSLQEIYQFADNTNLNFREVVIYSIKCIIISFIDSTGTEQFYDFSQNPLKGKPILTKNIFSPL